VVGLSIPTLDRDQSVLENGEGVRGKTGGAGPVVGSIATDIGRVSNRSCLLEAGVP
jgi:hypothetical protein